MPDEAKRRGADRRKADPVEEAERQRRHRKRRGQSLASLNDLSRVPRTKAEILEYREALDKESDRGAAIMAGALVEASLRRAICSRIADPGEETIKQWFDNLNAPFLSFASKIALGQALAIYGAEVAEQLKLIKEIRNKFAHAPHSLDFDHAAISDLCATLLKPFDPSKDETTKVHFGRVCRVYALMLSRSAVKGKLKAMAKKLSEGL